MKKLFLLVILLGVICQMQTVQGQTKVENFTLTNLLDDTSVSLDTYKEANCVAIFFTSSRCPYTKSYKTRIIDLAKKYEASGVQFILINTESIDEPSDLMYESAREYNLPYLFDKGLAVSNQFQASKTPEVFILENHLGDFVVKYFGAIDDNPQMAEEVSQHYADEAIKAVIEKQNLPYTEQKPSGCIIRR